MPGPPFLHGEKVDLHTVVEADAEFIARGRNDPAVRPWLPRSRPHAVAEAREDVEGYMSDDSDGLGLLACVDGDPVGLVSMFMIEADSGRALVAAWFVPEAQGKGYGTDAVGRLVEYGFDERRLHRIGASARADNDASRATLEKLGFVREGCRREHYYVDGEYVDRITYGLLESEWRAD
ncbi:GNAT family N-acetyltransferase [Halobacteriales archaeon QS_4_69_225]|nr:MAG: GNAT family N-acetyltransferase [Halobacteriales archaeon QS_4_69_225]